MKVSFLFALTAFAACDPSDNTDPHPTDALDFPVSVVADPSGERVWVVSGNFDLRFRNAAVLSINVADNAFEPERAFEVGGFPGELELLAGDDGKLKAAYIPSREDDRIYFATFDADGMPSCPKGEVKGDILVCPKSGAIDHTTVETEDDKLEIDVGTDPFGAAIVPKQNAGSSSDKDVDLLLTGAMGNGRLAMFELASDGTPTLVGGVDLFNGLYGLVTNPKSGRAYVSSKLANVVTTLDIAPRFDIDTPEQPDKLDPVNPYVTVAGTIGIPEPRATDRGRAIAVSSDGTRLYVGYRAPDSLVVLDIADGSGGQPRSRVLQKIALDDDPTDVVVVPQPDGTDLVYVSCFRADRIEVIDPDAGEIIGGVHVGDGPSGMAFVDNGSVRRLYVALFHGDAVGVVELDPTSPFFHTEVGEIR